MHPLHTKQLLGGNVVNYLMMQLVPGIVLSLIVLNLKLVATSIYAFSVLKIIR